MAAEKLPWGLKAKGLAPGSMKNISENKLKAFNIGSMNIIKGTTKKEQEDLRKRREQEEAAEVYKEFVESFDDADKGLNRSWVKGGLVHPEKGEEKLDKGNRLYKPTSKLSDKKSPVPLAKPAKTKEEEKPERPNKPTPTPQRLWTPTPVETGSSSSKNKKVQTAAEKRKTNLELFKEELKVIQEERQERRKVRQELGLVEDPARKTRFNSPEPVATGVSMGIKPTATTDDYRLGSYNYDNDTQTTNIYLGNINPKMTEMQLCEIFGKFGPLASVKVMWPRTEEEKARGRNCGFVAYMNRKDGERALCSLQGKDIMDFEMKLGWGKAVPIPPHPIYIPPALTELTQPPPPSGLPFNAQPLRSKRSDRDDKHEDPDKTLANAIVKVVIPTERNLLNIIHRMVEFVVREGPMFEAMIMNRELQNPMFRFLFENQSPAHVYYRWKLFSILQGDSPFRWRTEEFCMFKGGSIWRPPQMNPYAQGMPEELLEGSDAPSPIEELLPKKGGLTDGQRDRLEDMLRDLTPERTKIGDCMVWCLDHADSAEEVVDCIAESLSILQTPIPKKIARLFLISDILHNCSARVAHASFFRRYFEVKLPEIFKDVHEAYEKIDARLKAEQFKQKVMACFRAWEDWAIYTSDFLINLQNVFLGLVPMKQSDSPVKEEEDLDGLALDDVDGVPLDELDGMPLDGELDGEKPKLGEELVKGIVPYGDDLDGEPVELVLKVEVDKPKPAFVPSKWETVDEAELEKQGIKRRRTKNQATKTRLISRRSVRKTDRQRLLDKQFNRAMTVSKWDLLDQKRKEEEEEAARLAAAQDEEFQDEDIDGKPLDDDDDQTNASDDDTSRQKSEVSSWHVQDDSTAESVEASKDSQLDRERDRTDEDRLSAQLRHELSEAKRAKLREIELKVMRYQDELEAGRRSRKPEMSIVEQVDHYRRKQLRKEEEKEKEVEYEKHREDDRSADRSRDRGRGREKGRDGDRYEDDDVRDDSRHRDGTRSDRDADRSSDRSGRSRHRDRRDSDDERSRDNSDLRTRERDRGDGVRVFRETGFDRSSYRDDKRHRDPGSERVSQGSVASGYRDASPEAYYPADRDYGNEGDRGLRGNERVRGDQREDSGSPSETGYSGASSYVQDPSIGPSPLVSYARSQSSDSPRTYDDDDDDNRSSHRRKHRHRSPKKSSKPGSPRATKRSRSRSQNRHKHKKSRRS